MEAYEIETDIFRIPGGFGKSGEIYGGILLNDTPPILIGASGNRKFVSNLIETLNELKINSDELRLYLTNVTFEELTTLETLQKQLPNVKIFVHDDIAECVESPKDKYLEDRFYFEHDSIKRNLTKILPKKINNVIRINKTSSLETKKTKILIVPFGGPHKGHTFIYSRDHKLLFSGLVTGFTPSNMRAYYLDLTGSLTDYNNAFEFLKQASSNIIAPSYDEPTFTKTNPISTSEVESSISMDLDACLEICSTSLKSFEELYREYYKLYGSEIITAPYNEIKLEKTILYHLLTNLAKQGKIAKENNGFKKL